MSRVMTCAASVLVCGGVALGQLQNPGFEIPGSSTVFQGWTSFNNAVPEFSIVRTGAVSLKCFGNGSGAFNASGAFQELPTTPGAQWEGRIFVLNSASDPILADNFSVLNIEWHRADGSLIEGNVPSSAAADAATPRDVWREVVVTGLAPAETAFVRLVPLHLQGPAQAAGAVFFDDASLLPTSSTGVVNPGFESDYAGWTPFGNAFIDGNFTNSGAKAAKMFGNFNGDFNASGCFQDFAAQPGQAWIGTAFAGTLNSDHVGANNFAVLNIEWRNSSNQLISFESALAVNGTTPGDVFNQITVQGTAPAGTAVARIVALHIQGPGNGGGAVWFDDVTFGQASAPVCDPDVNQDGNADQGDVDYIINVIAGGDNPTNIDPDFNQDGNSDQGDIDALVNVIAGGACP